MDEESKILILQLVHCFHEVTTLLFSNEETGHMVKLFISNRFYNACRKITRRERFDDIDEHYQ